MSAKTRAEMIQMHGVFEQTPVPEPGTVALVAFGLAGLLRGCRKRASKASLSSAGVNE